MTAALDYDTDHRPKLVLRRGRHRNRALASYRRSRAVEMAAGGCTYQRIADELGYANRGIVHRLVREVLEAQQVESVDLLRQVEVQRLDALQSSLWPSALAGDVEAAHACLRIILARAQVLGLAEVLGKRVVDYRGLAHDLRMQAVVGQGDRVLMVDDWAERGSQAFAARTLVED